MAPKTGKQSKSNQRNKCQNYEQHRILIDQMIQKVHIQNTRRSTEKTAQLVRECMNVQMCMQIFLQKMYINNTWNIPHAEVNVTGRLNRNNSMGNRMTEQDDIPDGVSIDTTMTTSSLSAPSQTAAETEEAIVGNRRSCYQYGK